MTKTINVGLLGCGFMGRTHSNAYSQVNHFFELEYKPVLKACYGREQDLEVLKKFQKMWGYESIETDWKKLIARNDIDLIDVVAPNFLHHDMVIAAAEAGKIIVCEKPMAMSLNEAEKMVAAVEKAGVANMVMFNYRRVPAVSLFKQVVEEGRIGKPFHYRAVYNQDYTISQKVPQGGSALWRLDAKIAGSGVTGDLLAHSIDTAEWINGPIKKVVAYTEIFIKERPHAETGKMEPITIDDACMFLAIFENGSIGTFESTRYARGRKNYSSMELNGERGAAYFNLEEPEYLQFFRYADPDTGNKIEDHLTGWQKILVTNGEHPYMSKYWVPGTTIGYEHTFINAMSDFLKSIEDGTQFQPNFRTAMRTQKVCDAVIQSAKEGRWIEI
ncbi:MAG: Gfo/Idh/MocA family oxidoreductase [Planctomycetaceae bacterium]|jgi:predicted dehydrogenase|nr:Gfo/Idh/MocA family oxidoreductase [Planctomycetaceae bacterium]